MVSKPLNTQKTSLGPTAQGKKSEVKAPANSSPEVITPKPKRTSGFIYRINEFLKEKFCSEQEIIGVEIQPDIIRFCQAHANSGTWEITKIGSVNVLNNYQQDSLKKNKSLYAKCLKELFESNKIENKSIALAIPAALAIIKTISLPLMSKENLDKATRIPSFWQNLVQISDNLADYSIYYRIVKENPASKEMDVLFIASKHEDIKTYIDIAREAGLEPCFIDVGCFSINNISKLKSESAADLKVFLKVGRDENYLQVLDNDKPYIYDLFVSDNEKSYLNEFLENQIFQQRFVSQLNHIISKHQDKYKVKLEKINVISSENNIDKFITAIGQKLEGINIGIIDLLENIKLPQELLNNEEFNKTRSSYAICIGLATRKLDIFADDNKMNISETVNLMPNGDEAVTALKAKFYSKILVLASTALCIIFLIIFSLISVLKFSSQSSEITEFNELNKKYKDRQKVFNELNGKSGNLNKIIKIKEKLYQNQPEIINAFEEISSFIPEGVWVEEINISSDGKITISGKSFEEKGIILFSKAFDNSQILSDVAITNLKSTALDNGSFVKEFLISGVFTSAKEQALKKLQLEKAAKPEKPVVQPQKDPSSGS